LARKQKSLATPDFLRIKSKSAEVVLLKTRGDKCCVKNISTFERDLEKDEKSRARRKIATVT